MRTIDFVHISTKFLVKNNRMLNRARLTQEKKLFNLGLRSAAESNDPEKVIFNFSSRQLSSAEKSLLTKGLNLSIPPKKLNYGDFLMPFESLFNQLIKCQSNISSCQTDPVSAAIKNAAFECLHSYDPKTEQNLSKDEYEALKSLLSEEDIVIQKSDKGNSVVILNKLDYITLMNELLADTSKFKKLNIDSGKDYNFIINQERRISTTLRNIKNSGGMLNSLYEKLNPTGTQPSVLYGLSKVHKPAVNNIPKLRPILSAINSPTYKLSQYLNKLLKPFTINEYTVRDSFSFATTVQSCDTSQFMASLDVDSLFTNIPLAETISICCDLLFRDHPIVDGLSKDDFRQLLTLATTESFILFNGSYYQQIDGVAMGSPLGPTLANVFLCYNEKKWLEDCPAQFKPSYYRRYVDDIFVLLPDASHLEKFRAYMSQQHPNINFTSEEETNNSLPFLDVHTIRHNHKYITSVYRKPTFSGVYTHYDSFIPASYKYSLVSTLLYRAFSICSSWDRIHTEFENIKSIMIRNGYPVELINRGITTFLSRIHKPRQKQHEDKQEPAMIVLPFLGNYTKRVEKRIKQSLRQHLPDVRVNFIYRASTRLRSLFSFKDRIPSYLQSGVVYQYTCSRCNSAYIGETTRHTKRRFHEHMGKSALTGKRLTNPIPSAVNDHSRTCMTTIEEKDFTILCRDTISEHNLQIKETLFIHRDKPVLNIQGASVPVKLFKS